MNDMSNSRRLVYPLISAAILMPSAACVDGNRKDQLTEYENAVMTLAINRKSSAENISQKEVESTFDITLFELKNKSCALFILKDGWLGRNYVVCFNNSTNEVVEEYSY
jgi:hypothetical protein